MNIGLLVLKVFLFHFKKMSKKAKEIFREHTWFSMC